MDIGELRVQRRSPRIPRQSCCCLAHGIFTRRRESISRLQSDILTTINAVGTHISSRDHRLRSAYRARWTLCCNQSSDIVYGDDISRPGRAVLGRLYCVTMFDSDPCETANAQGEPWTVRHSARPARIILRYVPSSTVAYLAPNLIYAITGSISLSSSLCVVLFSSKASAIVLSTSHAREPYQSAPVNCRGHNYNSTVGLTMFDTTFSHTSQTDLKEGISDQAVLQILHDFGTVIHLNPDCKGFQPAQNQPKGMPVPVGAVTYDCEDALTFIPKKLWDGGVCYTAVFSQEPDGCDIVIKAPGGFTSTNKWRLQMDRDGRKCVTTVSDAKCNRTFAGFVKKFLENSHATQQSRFKQALSDAGAGAPSRPGAPRRRSSWG